MSESTKTPAAVGAATGIHENICNREKEHPYDYDYTPFEMVCQCFLTNIIKAADDIAGKPNTDADIGYLAGQIRATAEGLMRLQGLDI